ncbi:hypothetical protein HYV70_04565, partial [Candidatus Uhrbacteria bacterium]|nr:hypothetical protein [Candidatus Uhrbacteria bacterium]
TTIAGSATSSITLGTAFTVAATTGLTTIAGAADGTDALVLTLGDILVSNGDLDLLGGDFNVTLDAADGASISTAAGTASATALTITAQPNNDSSADGLTVALTPEADGGNATNVTNKAMYINNITGTNEAGDRVVGLDIGTLTNGAGASDSAISINSGWDQAITIGDDASVSIGGTGPFDSNLRFETADANANAVHWALPESSATEVPVLFIGDASMDGLDLGFLDGTTGTSLALVSDDAGDYGTMSVTDNGNLVLDTATADSDISLTPVDELLITTGDNSPTDVNITGSVTVSNDLAVADDFSVEGIIDVGTIETMADNDLTPDVSSGSYFSGDAAGDTITAFDGDVAGQIWIIQHTTNTTFDCDNTDGGNDNLECGNADIVTATADLTMWISEGSGAADKARLISWVKDGAAQTGADLAEWFPANEDVQAGDVLVAAGSPEHVEKSTSSYQKGLMGVVSTDPGLILSQQGETFSALVALAGRVPVKVSDENGAIEIGDFLTSSATLPGYAMKATEAGPVIGMAMESFSGGQGEVIVKVENMWYVPTSSLQDASSSSLVVEAQTITAVDASFTGSVTVGEHLYGSHDMAGRVRMTSGTDHVTVTFTTPYAQLPIITFSSRSNSESAQGAWISNESVTGFTINRSLIDDQVEFNWIAVGVESAQVTVATDWSEGVSIDVTDTNGPVAPAPAEAQVESSQVETTESSSTVDSSSGEASL